MRLISLTGIWKEVLRREWKRAESPVARLGRSENVLAMDGLQSAAASSAGGTMEEGRSGSLDGLGGVSVR